MADYDYTYVFVKCAVCERKILVEVLFNAEKGSFVGTNACCQDCVLKSPTWEQFEKERPAQAKAIKDRILTEATTI